MTADDFISFLGKSVKFLFTPITGECSKGAFLLKEGVVHAVVISQDLSDTEFFLEYDTFKFSEVMFIEVLSNPVSP